MDEREKYQERMEGYDETVEAHILEELNPLFLEMIEELFENESDFTELLQRLHRLARSVERADDAHELRSWLRRKITDFARKKSEQEFPNIYWRNR